MLQAVAELKDSTPEFSEGYFCLIRMQHVRLQSGAFFAQVQTIKESKGCWVQLGSDIDSPMLLNLQKHNDPNDGLARRVKIITKWKRSRMILNS